MAEDLYQTLGITSDAEPKQIKKAYFRLVRKHRRGQFDHLDLELHDARVTHATRPLTSSRQTSTARLRSSSVIYENSPVVPQGTTPFTWGSTKRINSR